jgi:hypothetical protein
MAGMKLDPTDSRSTYEAMRASIIEAHWTHLKDRRETVRLAAQNDWITHEHAVQLDALIQDRLSGKVRRSLFPAIRLERKLRFQSSGWHNPETRLEMIKKRRRRTCGKIMPPEVAEHYSPAEQVVMRVVLDQLRQRKICQLPYERIASLAGCSLSTVQRTMRKARLLHHLTVVLQPNGPKRNDPNKILVASNALREWLAGTYRVSGSEAHSKKDLEDLRSSSSGYVDSGDSGDNSDLERLITIIERGFSMEVERLSSS